MGYFPLLPEDEGSHSKESSTESERAGRNELHVLLYASRDAVVAEGHEKGRVAANTVLSAGQRRNPCMKNSPAPYQASHSCRQLAQDDTCPLNKVTISLPFFYGVGWAEEQGKRNEMEDGTVVIRDFGGLPGAWLLAIYDGHGGRATVSLLLNQLHDNLLQLLQEYGERRWKSLKKQAHRRRVAVSEFVELHRQHNKARLQRMQCTQQRLSVASQREMQLGHQKSTLIYTGENVGIEAERLTPDPAYLLESDSLRWKKPEQVERYRQLLRTQQLLCVLQWIEGEHKDACRDQHNADDKRVFPHYLLICTEEDVRNAFTDAFRQTDEQLLRQGIMQSGATACVSILRPCINFDRLVIMEPQEFTDQDWELFSGKNILFPMNGRIWNKRHPVGDGPQKKCGAAHVSAGDLRLNAAAARGAFPGIVRCSSAAAVSAIAEMSSGCLTVDVEQALKEVDSQGTGDMRALSSLLSVKLSVAHLGDSRALLVALNGSCERLTADTDHKASSFQEMQRVERAGGWVFGERVNGMLAIGRAFGDWCLKLTPEEVQAFSAAAHTEPCAERTREFSQDGKVTGREPAKMQSPTISGNAVAADRALQRTFNNGVGTLLPYKQECIFSAVKQGGKIGDQEPDDAARSRLTDGSPRANNSPTRNCGPLLAKHYVSSEHPVLVVSNEPAIRTIDIMAFKNADLAKNKAEPVNFGNVNGIRSGARRTSTNYRRFDAMQGAPSARGCRLTAPPVLLLLGCDGLFDVCSDHAATAIALGFLKELQEAHPDLTPSSAAEAVARALIEEAITFRGSTDNVSVTVALLHPMDFRGKEDGDER